LQTLLKTDNSHPKYANINVICCGAATFYGRAAKQVEAGVDAD
jgi:hypothetical protein